MIIEICDYWNVAENWRAFEMDFDIYVAAARLDADDKTISNMYLTCCKNGGWQK